MDYNKTIHTGRLTADPELKSTNGGKSVCSFTIAVNGKNSTDFFPIVAWDNQAEFISKYAHKGSLVLVDGRLSNRKWEDKNGNQRVTTEIIVDKVNLLEKKNYEAPNIEIDTNDPTLFPAEGSDLEEDLPF